MRHSVLLVGASLSALVISSSFVRADGYDRGYVGPAPNYIIRSNNQLSIDFATTARLDYAERDPNHIFSVLDSETGNWIPGVSVTGSWMGTFYGGVHPYAWGRVTWIEGTTDYTAAAGPVTKNTDGALIQDEDFRLGLGFEIARNIMLTPYAGIGWHKWGRDLSGPFGYHEDYSNGYAGGGLLLQVAPVRRLVLSVNGLVGSTFDASMTASQTINPVLPFSSLSAFHLGSTTIEMVGGAADYQVNRVLHVNASVDYTHFGYGQSPPQLGGLLEPSSRTSSLTVRAGFGIAFGGDRDPEPIE
jgi:hypothetical protein